MTQLAMKQEDQGRKTDRAKACCHVGPPTVTIAPRKHDMGQMTAWRQSAHREISIVLSGNISVLACTVY